MRFHRTFQIAAAYGLLAAALVLLQPAYAQPADTVLLNGNITTRDERFSAQQALAAATSNFGEIFVWKEVGQIKAGYNSNLLVLDENPVKEIGNLKKIRLLFLKGEILDRDKLLVK